MGVSLFLLGLMPSFRDNSVPKTPGERDQIRLSAEDEDFQFAPIRMVFAVKPSGKRKAWLVIGGHVVDSGELDRFCTHMKTRIR